MPKKQVNIVIQVLYWSVVIFLGFFLGLQAIKTINGEP